MMWNYINDKYERSKKYVKSLIKWLTCSIIIGVICGLIGTAFYQAVEKATKLQGRYPWLLFLLPVGGVVIVFLYHICGVKNAKGTNMIIESIRSSEKIPFIMAPLIFIGTVITHLCGGSSGREGAALQIGGSIGAFLGRIMHLNEKDMHVIVMCGMSAVFSALFGTPLTATIFSMEVVSVGVIYYAAFLPCIVSSIVACSISRLAGFSAEKYSIPTMNTMSLGLIIKVIILAALCALVSSAFIICMHKTAKLYKDKINNQYIRIIVGGFLIILLTAIVGTRDYNGAGMNIVKQTFSGKVNLESFFLKIIFTVVTLGAGYKGGEIVPSFFIGATFGNAVGNLMNINPGFGAAIGMVSVFCGVVNCPITAMFLSVELFGSGNVILFALACAVSYVLSGYYSLYKSQKIIYSKLTPEYINAHTK